MKRIIAAVVIGTAVVASAQLAQSAVRKVGVASWYKMGKITANGERFNPNGLTAAHRYLPFGTVVRVTNLRNGRKVVVRINDRGPFVKNRIIDLAYGAARRIGLNRSGIAKVRLDIIKKK
ncbi:MAG TPA: septal ring lytic transglycosylase RlpA family protein [Rhizobiales bacterium]|nr:septal ring lytic transglycosylase RlpA family protein [Hyphomicrobiales bacterium]